jgi:teichuronic acid biosynthesis glycosyltransferase TuaH
VSSYLSGVDVGITPYRDTPFNRASFPLKTLEYLGSGLPVVSSDLPTARWLRDDLASGENSAEADQTLALARSGADFVAAIRRITATGHHTAPVSDNASLPIRDEVSAARRVALAASHSWSRRADMFAATIGLPQINGSP